MAANFGNAVAEIIKRLSQTINDTVASASGGGQQQSQGQQGGGKSAGGNANQSKPVRNQAEPAENQQYGEEGKDGEEGGKRDAAVWSQDEYDQKKRELIENSNISFVNDVNDLRNGNVPMVQSTEKLEPVKEEPKAESVDWLGSFLRNAAMPLYSDAVVETGLVEPKQEEETVAPVLGNGRGSSSSAAANPFTAEAKATDTGYRSTADRDFSEEAEAWLANSGLGYQNIMDFLGNASYDEVARYMQDENMRDWYASEFANGYSDEAFDAYWNKYKPTSLDDAMKQANYFGTDQNLIYDLAAMAYDLGYLPSMPDESIRGEMDAVAHGMILEDENGNQTQVDPNREAIISALATEYLFNSLADAKEQGMSTEQFNQMWGEDDLNALMRNDYYYIGEGDDFGGQNIGEVFNNPEAFSRDTVFWMDPNHTDFLYGQGGWDMINELSGGKYNIKRKGE